MLTILEVGVENRQARNILGRKKTIATWEELQVR